MSENQRAGASAHIPYVGPSKEVPVEKKAHIAASPVVPVASDADDKSKKKDK